MAALQGGENDVLELVDGLDDPDRHLVLSELLGSGEPFAAVQDHPLPRDLEWFDDAAFADVGL